MKRTTGSPVLGIVMVCVGLFGAAFAISGLLSPLPLPPGGGTCGPGAGSEAAIVAFFDPGTIGAGPEPPASQAASHAGWVAFVHSCQTSTDRRAAVTIPIGVVSVVLAVVGLVLVVRRYRGGAGGHVDDGIAAWSPASPAVPVALGASPMALASTAGWSRATDAGPGSLDHGVNEPAGRSEPAGPNEHDTIP